MKKRKKGEKGWTNGGKSEKWREGEKCGKRQDKVGKKGNKKENNEKK